MEIISEIHDSFYNVYKMEQEILRSNKAERIVVSYKDFYSTECFKTDLLKEYFEKSK